MLALFLLLAIALLQVVPSILAQQCLCGRPSDTVSMRIVGGRRAEPHSYPWVVAIMKNDRMHCGGAIVTNKHVLSAGHCFKWDNFTTMEAFLGLDSLDDLRNVAKRTFIDVYIHEKFTSTAVRDENDIAIATLNEPVVFSDTIVPVCLPKHNQDFTGLVGTIVGWGRMGTEMSSSRVLLKASLRLLPYEECLKSKLKQHLKPTMMCAFSKGKDGCQGDSGGPLLVFEPSGRYVQAGIVSWGIGCADPKYPEYEPAITTIQLPLYRTTIESFLLRGIRALVNSVYTKVSDYIDWIAVHTAGGQRCAD